mmetsp:Transcript_60727/g.146155  ORF Transcript_60727/g.146155 Transcript_60727/m.146155 type:complete len:255 (-) Transcript_60727:105-869(-)
MGAPSHRAHLDRRPERPLASGLGVRAGMCAERAAQLLRRVPLRRPRHRPRGQPRRERLVARARDTDAARVGQDRLRGSRGSAGAARSVRGHPTAARLPHASILQQPAQRRHHTLSADGPDAVAGAVDGEQLADDERWSDGRGVLVCRAQADVRAARPRLAGRDGYAHSRHAVGGGQQQPLGHPAAQGADAGCGHQARWHMGLRLRLGEQLGLRHCHGSAQRRRRAQPPFAAHACLAAATSGHPQRPVSRLVRGG